MVVVKPVLAVTPQRIFTSWRGIFNIEPSLVPIFGVAMQLGMRKTDIFPLLNNDSTKFLAWPVNKFSLAV
mgnify:CR=1 FL=1